MTRLNRVFFLFCLICWGSNGASAQDGGMAFPGTLSEGPQIATSDLELLLKPMTLNELQIEMDRWRQCLQDKIKELSLEEIRAKRFEGERKTRILEKITRLGAEKTALIDRYVLVADALEKKGGDVEEYRKYKDAVAGIVIKVTDTQSAWTTAFGWIKSPEGGIRYGKKIGFFLLTLAGFWVLALIIGKVVKKGVSSMKKASELLKEFLVGFARKAVFVIGLVVALSMLEVDVGPFIAAIGVMGFVIGFALQGPLSNFACGIMILMYRPYDVGDRVIVGGQKGRVKAMSMVSTTIHTLDNQTVVVPNSCIWEGVITNTTGNTTRRVDLTFSLRYTEDVNRAKRIICDILERHEQVLKDPAPVVRLDTMNEYSVTIICRPWTLTENFRTVRWDVTEAVKERFAAEGVKAPFPQHEVHLHKSESPEGYKQLV